MKTIQRVKVIIDLKKPDEISVRFNGRLSRGHFVAVTACPIEYLVVGGGAKLRIPYTIQFTDNYVYLKNARYDLVITSGALSIKSLVFNGTATLTLE